MTKTSTRQAALCGTLLAATAFCGLHAAPAAAQTSVYDLPEKLVDANGVDLPAGKFLINFPVVQFGDGIRLKADYFARYPEPGNPNGFPNATYAFNFITRVSYSNGLEEIETGWSPLGAYAYYRLATLETVMPDGRTYSKPAGGRFLTELHSASWQTPGHHPIGMVDEEGNFWEPSGTTANAVTSRVTFADGEIWTTKNEINSFSSRQRNVVSNRGYMIQYEYEREAAPTTQADVASWTKLVKISGGSLAHNYCDTSGVALCVAISAAGNSVTLSYFANGYEMTHASGFKKRLEYLSPNQLLLSTPGTAEQVKVTYGITPCDPYGSIAEVTRNGQTWHYAYEQCTEEERGISWLLTRTDPLGRTIKVRQLSSYSIPDSYTDELGREFGFGGDPAVGYVGFSYPEGNAASRNHNSRNDITNHYAFGKSGGLLSTGATYDAVCANLITCNRPNTTTDAKGNTTTYTYDPVHGGVKTRTGPAVDGISPQTRHDYAQKYAWLKNSSGGYSQADSPIWVLVQERSCRKTAASGAGCQGGSADEVVSDYDYGPASGPNNLLVRGVAVTADGQTRRTCFSYDEMGRKISTTTPRAGLTACP
jgi:hypothetical protein